METASHFVVSGIFLPKFQGLFYCFPGVGQGNCCRYTCALGKVKHLNSKVFSL